MKYKPARDLPQFSRKYRTVSPSELANIVGAERNKKITSEAVTMWFKRHPNIHDELTKELDEFASLKKEDVSKSRAKALAELFTSEYGTIKVVNLETVELAKKLLALVESDLKKSAQKEKET